MSGWTAPPASSESTGWLGIVLTVVLFQAAWIASALAAAGGRPWIGVLACAVVVAIHLWRSTDRQRAILVVALTLFAGLAVETALIRFGVVSTTGPSEYSPFAPLWLIALWGAFATLLPDAFRPLIGRYWLAAVVGAVFGPLAYLAGTGLGALVIPEPVAPRIAAIAVVWAVALPQLLVLQRRFGAAPGKARNSVRPAP